MPIFRICFRKDTAENWEKNNPILLKGEVGYEVDDKGTIKSKMGDGYLASDGKVHGTPWNDLPYVSGPPGPAGLSPEHKWEGSRLFFQNSDGTWDGGQSLIGPMPAHRWLGTSLQWETPSGAWGDAVDLQGVPGDAYSLPPATTTQLGGIMIGDGLVVNESGCASVSAATTAKAGIVQLSSSVNSTSETLAATPKAVKTAYDKAVDAAGTAYELCEVYHFLNPKARPGFVQAVGGLIQNANTKYPEAFAYLQTSEGQALCVTESKWQEMSKAIYFTRPADGTAFGWNGIGGVPKYVIDVSAGTIRVPDLRGMYAETGGFIINTGEVHGPASLAASGSIDFESADGGQTPVRWAGWGFTMHNTSMKLGGGYWNSTGSGYPKVLWFNTNRYIPESGYTIQPRAYGVNACVYLGK